jgi:outer membrane protein, adhesin transport system
VNLHRNAYARLSPLCAITAAALLATPAAAVPIEVVIRTAIADYPSIRIARSNREIAAFRIDEARAQHLPVFDVGAAARVTGPAATQPLPRARINVYAGGSIDARIDREALREQAFASREDQVREDVAFAAAQAYLRLLRGHRLVAVQQQNIERHEKLVGRATASLMGRQPLPTRRCPFPARN